MLKIMKAIKKITEITTNSYPNGITTTNKITNYNDEYILLISDNKVVNWVDYCENNEILELFEDEILYSDGVPVFTTSKFCEKSMRRQSTPNGYIETKIILTDLPQYGEFEDLNDFHIKNPQFLY